MPSAQPARAQMSASAADATSLGKAFMGQSVVSRGLLAMLVADDASSHRGVRSGGRSNQPLGGAAQAVQNRLVGFLITHLGVDHVDGRAESARPRRDAQPAPIDIALD